MIKHFYEIPQCDTVDVQMERGVMTTSVLVTLSLIGDTPGTDTRDMNLNDPSNW